MPAQSSLVFIQILIHIQSNMLESLLKILEDSLDTNLSKFVRRHTFSEEVVSVPTLQVTPSASSRAHLVFRSRDHLCSKRPDTAVSLAWLLDFSGPSHVALSLYYSIGPFPPLNNDFTPFQFSLKYPYLSLAPRSQVTLASFGGRK
jgi:hypothetical protein